MTRMSRFAARLGLAFGIWILAFAAGIVLQGCDSGSVSGPTPTTEAPAPVAAAPAPAPTPTPGAVAGEDPAAFTLEGYAPSTIRVTYNGEAAQAKVETFYTSFDDQTTAFGKQQHTVSKGAFIERAFGQVCIQGDADQPGVKLIGGIFFDIDGKPFNPTKEPAKTKACRDRCVPEWKELEERSIGEWEDYQAPPSFGEAAITDKCYKDQRRLIIVFEENKCPQGKRELRRFYEYRKVEIPCPCVYERPSHSGTGFTEEDRDPRFFFTDWWVKATANVQGAATWKLELYSASSVSEYDANDPDFTKATISRTLTCNESVGLYREYNSDGHGSDVWWAALYRDNLLVWKSQAEFN